MANVRDAVISDSVTSEKLTLTYRFGDNNLVYVTGATAARPGGINRLIPRGTDPVLDPIGFACARDLAALGFTDPNEPAGYLGDEVTSTEFGWKLLFRDSSVRFNGAVYSVTWDDIQQEFTTTSECGNNPTLNAGEAKSTGVELELTAAVNDNLTLFANLGYIDAQFEETVQLPVPGANPTIEKGDLLADVPELTYTVGFDYTIPSNSGEYFVLGNLNYVDETLEVPGRTDTDLLPQGIDSTNVRPDYTVVDLRVGYISENGWEVTLFADNVTDEEAVYGFNDAIAFNFPDGTDPTVRNRPRTIGVSVQYRFD